MTPMTYDPEKLKMLLSHWMEHNAEHAETYRQWSEKALSSGNKALSEALDMIYLETKKLNGLFEEAVRAAGHQKGGRQGA